MLYLVLVVAVLNAPWLVYPQDFYGPIQSQALAIAALVTSLVAGALATVASMRARKATPVQVRE